MTEVPYFRQPINKDDIEAVATSIGSGWLTTGPRVHEFEESFAAAVGAKHAVALNSCTAALHLALIALHIGPGDEVLVPTVTFAATAEVVLAVGATPVLVDCRPDTLALDVDHAISCITGNTKAIMPMHYGGSAADMAPILELRERHGIAIVEDAAHAFPASFGEQSIGTIGDATCFSFYANKTITTGEGGMVTTDSADIADRVRRLSLHGLSRDAWRRFDTRAPWDYDIVEAGWKYNMTDGAAALGSSQLKRAESFADERRAITATYDAAFLDEPHVWPREIGPLEKSSCHLYVVRLRDQSGEALDRDTVSRELGDLGIGTSVHYRPLHMHSFYRKFLDVEPEAYPVAANQFKQILSLPIFPGMTEEEQQRVINSLRHVLRQQ